MVLIQKLPTVNSIFTTLVLMGTIVYFLPYLFLAVGYFKLKARNELSDPIISKATGYSCAVLLFTAVILGILLSFVPNGDIQTQKAFIIYELELIGGPIFFIAIGYFLYHNHRQTS